MTTSPTIRGAHHGVFLGAVASLTLAAFARDPFNYLCGAAIGIGFSVTVVIIIRTLIARREEKFKVRAPRRDQWH